MGRFFIALLFVLLFSGSYGQMTITQPGNGLLPGDTTRTRGIEWIDPGNAGESVVWDFSSLRVAGTPSFYGVVPDEPGNSSTTGQMRLTYSEDGYDYRYNCNPWENVESGYINNAKKMTLELSDPIVRMKYPFAYGQEFTDTFEGVAWYNRSSRIDLGGNFTATADAFGTLVFTDRIIRNALRVKTVKKSLQIGVCGSNQCTVIKYYWYAPGYRYPVMMLNSTENKYGVGDPVYVRSGWVNLDQPVNTGISGAADPTAILTNGDNAVVVYPNPFSEKSTYSYYLCCQVPVTVELCDISGRFDRVIEQRQIQSEGLHTGTIDAIRWNLAPGIYSLRFTIDRQVIVTKIVKI